MSEELEMNSKLSKFSPRTNAMIAGATLLAVMFAQNVTAGVVAVSYTHLRAHET